MFELISDLHKEARGTRPSSDWMRAFNASTTAEQQAEWDRLVQESARRDEEEAEYQARAVAALEARVTDLIALGAADRATAIRWIADAEGVDPVNDPHGFGYLEFLLNVPYGYLEKEAA